MIVHWGDEHPPRKTLSDWGWELALYVAVIFGTIFVVWLLNLLSDQPCF